MFSWQKLCELYFSQSLGEVSVCSVCACKLLLSWNLCEDSCTLFLSFSKKDSSLTSSSLPAVPLWSLWLWHSHVLEFEDQLVLNTENNWMTVSLSQSFAFLFTLNGWNVLLLSTEVASLWSADGLLRFSPALHHYINISNEQESYECYNTSMMKLHF